MQTVNKLRRVAWLAALFGSELCHTPTKNRLRQNSAKQRLAATPHAHKSDLQRDVSNLPPASRPESAGIPRFMGEYLA